MAFGIILVVQGGGPKDMLWMLCFPVVLLGAAGLLGLVIAAIPHTYKVFGPAVDHTKNGTRVVYHAGFWGVLFIASPEEEAVAIVTLGQSNAETWRFWAEAKEYIANLF